MRKIVDFFRLIRTGNLLIIAITQLFAYYFLNKQVSIAQVLISPFFYLILSTVMVAAAGYIINDYMDVKLDLVNKPQKVVIGQSISRRWAMFLHFTLNILSIVLALMVSIKVALLIVFCTLLLWFYSQYLKKTYLAGNILVSLLTAFTIAILWFFNTQINSYAVIIYSVFAFFTTLIREIIKDTEDIRGDEKFKAKTLPISLGVRKTKNILMALQVVLLALTFMLTSFFGAISLTQPNITFLFIIYALFLVCLPMAINLWLIKIADVKTDFTRLSLLTKINMIMGILSMCFWKY